MPTLDLARPEAESLAWPYVSEHAFSHATITLQRDSVGVLSRETRDLGFSLERHLRLRTPGASLETLGLVRDACWFGDGLHARLPAQSLVSLDVPLHEHLRGIARARLRLAGTTVAFAERPGCPAEELARRWRWISLAMPQDLLVAALVVSERVPPPCDRVTLAAPSLAAMLRDRNVAQVHEHLGAAVSFELLWTHLVARVAMSDLPPKEVAVAGAEAPFGSWKNFAAWVVVAALARLTIGSYLWRRERGNKASFDDFMCEVCKDNLSAPWHARAIYALLTGTAPPSATRTRHAYRRFWKTGPARWPPRSLDEVRQNDPLSRWLGHGERAHPETHFLTRALAHIDGGADERFTRLFWQYVRVRARTHRHLCQEPGTPGLDWFSSHYQRLQVFQKGLEEVEVEAAIALQAGARLRSLEVRGAPKSSWTKIRDRTRQVERARSEEPMERALVLHFVKERGASDGRPRCHADPRQRAFGCRYGAFFHQRREQALAIEGALRRMPQLLTVLRGLDVCNLELAVPHWVFFPLLQRLRAVSARVASRLTGQVPELRLTPHVGEDFRHLTEGLRRVHEPIEFGILRSGDRLGHAIALGEDVAHWADSHPRVVMPAEERLDDLLWELTAVREHGLQTEAARLEVVRASVDNLAHFIFGASVSVEHLLVARQMRHDPPTLARKGYPYLVGAHEEHQTPDRLLMMHLTDPDVYERGQHPVEIVIDLREREALLRQQRHVQDAVSRLGLTVESNPSSNLLIGEVPHDRHPAFRLQPIEGAGTEGAPMIPVALGDDDPATFASCLPEEYAYIYHALVRQGVASAAALAWLDRVRENGWLARFSLPQSASVGAPRGPAA